MDKTKKEKLIEFIKRCVEYNQHIRLIVINNEMCHPEVIAFNPEDGKYKIDYIKKTYDDDLVHKHAAHIRIGGWE